MIARFVVVTFEPVAFVKVTACNAVVPVTFKAETFAMPSTVSVDVTVEEAPTKPPYKTSVEVAKLPRAVTVARVSVSTVAGQFTPFCKQINEPFTKRLVVETVVAPIQLDVALVKFALVESKSEKEPFVACTRVANNVVAVTLVSVAFAPIKFWSEVKPRTVSVEVTVEDPPTKPP